MSDARPALQGIVDAIDAGHVAVAIHRPPTANDTRYIAGISLGVEFIITRARGYVATAGLRREDLLKLREQINGILGDTEIT